jgi:hypothetical protein
LRRLQLDISNLAKIAASSRSGHIGEEIALNPAACVLRRMDTEDACLDAVFAIAREFGVYIASNADQGDIGVGDIGRDP